MGEWGEEVMGEGRGEVRGETRGGVVRSRILQRRCGSGIGKMVK